MTGVEIALIASAAIGAVSAMQAGAQASQTANYNAAVLDRRAANIEKKAAFDEARFREQARSLISSQRAAAGASGNLLEGSGMEVLLDTVEDAELDALAIRYSGSVEASEAASQAGIARLEGRQAKSRALVGAGASLLKGAGGLYQAGSFDPGGTFGGSIGTQNVGAATYARNYPANAL